MWNQQRIKNIARSANAKTEATTTKRKKNMRRENNKHFFRGQMENKLMQQHEVEKLFSDQNNRIRDKSSCGLLDFYRVSFLYIIRMGMGADSAGGGLGRRETWKIGRSAFCGLFVANAEKYDGSKSVDLSRCTGWTVLSFLFLGGWCMFRTRVYRTRLLAVIRSLAVPTLNASGPFQSMRDGHSSVIVELSQLLKLMCFLRGRRTKSLNKIY